MQESKLKLLVVDDDDVDRERIRRMLNAANVDVEIEEAIDARESISILNDCEYDCIIVDYRLGETDGLSLLNSIRTTLAKQCAVIMVTGLGDEQVAAEAMRLGASDYLIKNELKTPQLLSAILGAVHKADLKKQLHALAHYDALTGLVNRPLLIDRIDQAISLSTRADTLSALAFIDLDNFKPVNDKYGHQAGDVVLVEIANRLKSGLRQYDTVSRIGGDEFVILLTGLENLSECELLLERIRIVVNAPIALDRANFTRVSASIGVALIKRCELNADTMLRRADQSMYLAKKSGKNRVIFFDPEEESKFQERRHLLERVELGLENNEFELYYQPKVNLLDNKLIGLEALIRWHHPEKGLQAPWYFVDALEHATLGISIGEWVLKTVIEQLSQWNKCGLDITVSINISVVHLQDEGFVEQLEAYIKETPDVQANQIELEILESSSIKNMDTVIGILQTCRAIGVKIALDDFGTGYASLSYLKKLPLDTLKIDKSFIINMLDDSGNQVIVESIIALSKAFGYELIAEGIETAEHVSMYTDMGGTCGQGFAIAHPMPSHDVLKWVQDYEDLAV
ncbi:two-component system response regulator [Pseudoalteromonas xiamenensis]